MHVYKWPCSSHLPCEFLQVLEWRKGRAKGGGTWQGGRRTSEGGLCIGCIVTRTLRNGGKPRCSLARLRGRNVWLRMPVLRESRIVVGERERGWESGWVRPTMAFPDLFENTWPRRAVPGRERIYYRVYRPRRRWTQAFNPNRLENRASVLYISRCTKTILIFGCYIRTLVITLEKGPRGAPPSDRLNICVCGWVWFVYADAFAKHKSSICKANNRYTPRSYT